jgi:hypothetical protein
MKNLILIATLLISGSALATPMQIQGCTIASVSPFAQAPTGQSFTANLTTLAWVSASNTGSSPFCKKLTGVPNGSVSPTNGFVSSTADGGKTFTWVSIPVALAGTTTPVTPPPTPVAGTATITWTAVTQDTSGATISIPITYNVYRGPTSAMVKIVTGAVSPYIDNNVVSGVSYCWAVTSQDANGESAQSNPVCLTIALPPSANKPATPANVTAK